MYRLNGTATVNNNRIDRLNGSVVAINECTGNGLIRGMLYQSTMTRVYHCYTRITCTIKPMGSYASDKDAIAAFLSM